MNISNLKVVLRCLMIGIFLSIGLSRTYGADPTLSVYIDNAAYTATDVFEFDILVKSSGGTTSFDLRTFQAGIWVNSAWVNGGSLTLQQVAASSQLNGSGYNGTMQWNATDKFINCSVNTGVVSGNTYIFTTVGTAPVLITRIRVTNSVPFPCGALPNLKFNYVQNISPVRLRTSVSWRPASGNVNYDMFYPDRPFTGQAFFNGELYSASDADGRSPVSIASSSSNPSKPCNTVLNLTVFIEGYMDNGNPGFMHTTLSDLWFNYGIGNPTSDQTATDTIDVELFSPANALSLGMTPDYAARVILHNDGSAQAIFGTTIQGAYYIAVRHRSSIETWSRNPVEFGTGSVVNYDFSGSLSSAYDDGTAANLPYTNPPMHILVNGKFGIYSGDCTKDGTMDILDMGEVYNDGLIGYFGYTDDCLNYPGAPTACDGLASDCNGDGGSDILDMGIIYNNAHLMPGFFYARPGQ